MVKYKPKFLIYLRVQKKKKHFRSPGHLTMRMTEDSVGKSIFAKKRNVQSRSEISLDFNIFKTLNSFK